MPNRTKLQAAAAWTPDLGSSRGGPKHKRLADRIIGDIESGAPPAGARMPTHRELAHRLRMSVQTVPGTGAPRTATLSGTVAGRTHRAPIAPPI